MSLDVTSTSLLQGLEDAGNRTIWRQYVDRYRPLIVGYLRRLGDAPNDAEDIAQAALLDFSEAYRAGRYRRDQGKLSSWLFGIVRNHHLRHVAARARGGRESAVIGEAEEPAADDELERRWEEEWRRRVLEACVDEVRREFEPTTIRAFERFALDDRPAREVAAELGLTENAVFGAKRRVLARIREVLPMIEEAW